MGSWFGPIRTRHNPPAEALNMKVTVVGPVVKNDTIQLVIPVVQEMVLSKGTEIVVLVEIK